MTRKDVDKALFQEYAPVFSALTDYLVRFEKDGYDEKTAVHIEGLLTKSEHTPLNDLFDLFNAPGLERSALMLVTLVNFSARAARIVASRFHTPVGSVTPEAVCELFRGVSDIFPLCMSLSADSLLDRVCDGVRLAWSASMTLKPFAARFIADGGIDDDAFLPAPPVDDSGYIALAGNTRAEREIRAAISCRSADLRRIIAVCGEEGSGRRTAVSRTLASVGMEYVMLRTDLRYDRKQIRELALKLALLGAMPVAVQSARTDSDSFIRFVDTLCEEAGTVVAVCEEQTAAIPATTETVLIKTVLPTMDEQVRIWERELHAYRTDETVALSELAGEFSFTAGGIKRALRFARMLASGETLNAADIKNGCCRSVNNDMGSKAVKINCIFGWDDIILPEQSKRLMKTACDQIRYRHQVYDTWGFSGKIAYGKSVSMIFTGPPGTGKTMAAQIIASELGLDIYRISLANVVSKYIGETEKNLDDIFQKAKKSRIVLFFDEADVLFSKRTEVKDSNDKYSNMESAFLLQKIEEYNGVVILATNFIQNFDEAFKRRIKLTIDFPFPDREMRMTLWKKAFPKELPLDHIDYEYLVNRFELSGSNIKNIALHSAFLAAAESSPVVGMKHIVTALKNEYAKSGKAFTKSEAGEYFYYIDG